MRLKARCRGCEGGHGPRSKLCPTCRRIVREQQVARVRQEQAKKAPLTLHELTAILQRLQAQRGQGATS